MNVFAGYVILLVGIATMFHPTFRRGVSSEQVRVGNQETTVRTEEVITIPRWLSFVVIVGGGLLILTGSPMPIRRQRRRR
jgi:cytochrome c biogenesis protein CcdA